MSMNRAPVPDFLPELPASTRGNIRRIPGCPKEGNLFDSTPHHRFIIPNTTYKVIWKRMRTEWKNP
jgi:hypothetical protein